MNERPMRFGQRLGLKPERRDEYVRCHARIWPEIEQAIRDAGIRNYSIYCLPTGAPADRGGDELFGYYEYIGPPAEYPARMAALAAAPRMREWWDLMEAMQIPHPRRQPGAWWAAMDEVFHQD
jgi:L-rhamnose mutarotase